MKILSLVLLAGCAHVSTADIFAAAGDATFACGPGILSDGKQIGEAVHAGGADWLSVIGLIGAGIGDAICVARAVERHIKEHQVAGPGGAPGVSDAELRRRVVVRALARSVHAEVPGG